MIYTVAIDSRDFCEEKLAPMLYDGVFSRTVCLSRTDARVLAEAMIHGVRNGWIRDLPDIDRSILAKAIHDGKFSMGMHEYSWGDADAIAEQMLDRIRR